MGCAIDFYDIRILKARNGLVNLEICRVFLEMGVGLFLMLGFSFFLSLFTL